MALMENNNSINSSQPEDIDSDLALVKLLSSGKWAEYFRVLASSLNIELSGYGSDGVQLFLANENFICKFIRSVKSEKMRCPGSCFD